MAAQRFGAGGAWCADGESKVGRPKEFIPGRIFLHDSGQEIDPDSVLVSVAGSEGVDTTRYEREEETADSFVDLRLRIQLLCTPSTGLPSLAAAGSQDAVVGPKHCDLAVKYKLLPPAEDGGLGLTAVMTPAPSLPTCHGYNWEEVRREIDFSDLPHGGDDLIVSATYNVLYNAFATLVDVFLFYAHEHQQVLDLSAQQRVRKKVVEEELEVAHKEKIITHLGFAKFARACGLTGPGCSLFEVQRVSVNPEQMLPEKPPEGQLEGIPVDKFALRLFSFEYRLCAFLEALVRIAYFKHFSLGALCDRLNRLVHTQIRGSPAALQTAASISSCSCSPATIDGGVTIDHDVCCVAVAEIIVFIEHTTGPASRSLSFKSCESIRPRPYHLHISLHICHR